ncbi:hypothetical protein CLOM_g213, partial [Closterium sp. NIES-68]
LPVEVQAAADAAASAAAAAAAAKKLSRRDGDTGSASADSEMSSEIISSASDVSSVEGGEESRSRGGSGGGDIAGAATAAATATGAAAVAVGVGGFSQGLEDVELKMEIGKPGQSCDHTCAQQGLKCRADLLPRINSCPLLRRFFPCAPGCFASLGQDQPAEVVGAPGAISDDMPQHTQHIRSGQQGQDSHLLRQMLQDLRGHSKVGGHMRQHGQHQPQQQPQQRSQAQYMPLTCLVSLDPSLPSCEGRHPERRRLCPCSVVHS